MRLKQIFNFVGGVLVAIFIGVATAAIIGEGAIFTPPDPPPSMATSEAIATINAGTTRVAVNATITAQGEEVLIQPASASGVSADPSNYKPTFVLQALLCVFGPIIAGAFMGAVVGTILGLSTDIFDFMDFIVGIPGGIVGAIGGIAVGLFLGDFLDATAFSVIGASLWGAVWGVIGGAVFSVVSYRKIIAR